MKRKCEIGSVVCGPGRPLTVIAGPCVLEDNDLAAQIAGELAALRQQLDIQLIFKGSFDKANRTSVQAYRGVGLIRGIELLRRVQEETGMPVTTDIHLPPQAELAASVVDLLQIPAFLCRQTDLLLAAGRTGKAVHVKKGQFVSPWEMAYPLEKLRSVGCQNMLVGERGTFFGYGRLVNDMTAIPHMQALGVPVIFDATHSVQRPGGLGSATGGDREMVEPLARAAVAVGADGVFLETHPDPSQSPSDGPNMIPLSKLRGVLEQLVAIRKAIVLVLWMVMVICAGCQRREVQISTAKSQTERRSAALEQKDHVRAVLSFLNDYDQYPRDAILGRVLHHLRKWAEDKEPDDDWIADPMFGRLPARLQLQKNTAELARISFQRADVSFLREASWHRAIADRVRRAPQGDARHHEWLESQRSLLSSGDWLDLQTLLAIFDWVVRNVQVEPVTIDSSAMDPTAPAPRPGVRRTAWEALLVGRGDALCRARLVILIARQLEIPVVALAVDDDQEPPPCLLAGQVGGQWYLLEPELGLAVESGTPGSVATWSQLQADPDLLRQFDVAGRPYPVRASDISRCVALVDATPAALSQRMYLLELDLPSDAKLTLTVAPTALRRTLQPLPGIRRVAIWSKPYDVDFFRLTEAQKYPILIQRWRQELQPLNPPWPLGFARRQHIVVGDGVAEKRDDPRQLYMGVRLSDAQISAIDSAEALQAFLDRFAGLGGALPDDPRMIDELIAATRNVLVAMRRDASLWLGLMSFEAGEFRVAADYFEKRVLADGGTPWRVSASYNLGRSCEARWRAGEGEELREQAVEFYLQESESPQGPGNRIRAERLRD